MVTTERAAEKLRDVLIERFLNVGVGFRVHGDADESGRTTVNIKLDNERPGDVVIRSHGVKVLLDQRSATLLDDYELDYVDGPDGGFVVKMAEAQMTQVASPVRPHR